MIASRILCHVASTSGGQRAYSICYAQQSVRFPQDNLIYFVFWNSEFFQNILELRL